MTEIERLVDDIERAASAELLRFGALLFIVAGAAGWLLYDAVGTRGPFILLGVYLISWAGDRISAVVVMRGSIRAKALFRWLTLATSLANGWRGSG